MQTHSLTRKVHMRSIMSAQKRAVMVIFGASMLLAPVLRGVTFSDGNWISLGGIGGANGTVWAVVADGAQPLHRRRLYDGG
jgi:hypothetical protein